MEWLNDKAKAEQYIGSVVGVEDTDFGVILLRIYTDGFLTSAGFYKEILVPETPTSVNDTKDIVLYHACAATELPVNWPGMQCILANEKEILFEADNYIDALVAANVDPLSTGVFTQLKDVDLEKAEELAAEDRPAFESPDLNNLVFTGLDGQQHSWCLMFNIFN